MARKRIALYSGKFNVSGRTIAPLLINMKVPFATISEADVTANDLAGYSALLFPGGHSVQIGRKGDEHVREFVRKGGGFLGICAGLHYGADLKLLDIDMMYVRGGGMHQARVVKKHPVTAGYSLAALRPQRHKIWSPVKYLPEGRVKIARSNGGLIIPGENVDVLVTYDDTDRFAAVVAGHYGKGRVVLMSPHPEATPAPDKALKEKEQDAYPLLFNAVHYASRLSKRHSKRER